MKIRLRYFAFAAELAGCEDETVEMAAGSKAADALALAGTRHPGLAAAGFQPLVAVNRRHATLSQALADGDEVALLPPVSGG